MCSLDARRIHDLGMRRGRCKTTLLHLQLLIQKSWLTQLMCAIRKRSWLQQLSRRAIQFLRECASPSTMISMKGSVRPAPSIPGQAFLFAALGLANPMPSRSEASKPAVATHIASTDVPVLALEMLAAGVYIHTVSYGSAPAASRKFIRDNFKPVPSLPRGRPRRPGHRGGAMVASESRQGSGLVARGQTRCLCVVGLAR